jgi:hypothetical protein
MGGRKQGARGPSQQHPVGPEPSGNPVPGLSPIPEHPVDPKDDLGRRRADQAKANCRSSGGGVISSFARVQPFSVLAGRVVSGAAVFNPSDFGGNDLSPFRDLVIRFALDPALWRNLDR